MSIFTIALAVLALVILVCSLKYGGCVFTLIVIALGGAGFYFLLHDGDVEVKNISITRELRPGKNVAWLTVTLDMDTKLVNDHPLTLRCFFDTHSHGHLESNDPQYFYSEEDSRACLVQHVQTSDWWGTLRNIKFSIPESALVVPEDEIDVCAWIYIEDERKHNPLAAKQDLHSAPITLHKSRGTKAKRSQSNTYASNDDGNSNIREVHEEPQQRHEEHHNHSHNNTTSGGQKTETRREVCGACKGTGQVTNMVLCSQCATTGRILKHTTISTMYGPRVMPITEVCSNCNGKGHNMVTSTCRTCDGTGYRTRQITRPSTGGGSVVVTPTQPIGGGGSGGTSSGSTYVKCSSCNGSGVCSSCHGRGGRYENTGYYIGEDVKSWIDCPSCRGSGRCPICYGRGKL